MNNNDKGKEGIANDLKPIQHNVDVHQREIQPFKGPVSGAETESRNCLHVAVP